MPAAFAEPQEGAGVPLTPTASRAGCPRRSQMPALPDGLRGGGWSRPLRRRERGRGAARVPALQ